MSVENEERALTNNESISRARSCVLPIAASISEAFEALEREILRIELIDVRRP